MANNKHFWPFLWMFAVAPIGCVFHDEQYDLPFQYVAKEHHIPMNDDSELALSQTWNEIVVGNYDYAIMTLTGFRELENIAPSEKVEVLMQLGIARFEAGQLEAAVQCFSDVIAIDAHNPEALFHRSIISRFQGNNEVADRDWAIGKAIAPKQFSRYYVVGAGVI